MRAMAAAPSAARTRPRSTAAPPTAPVTSPRTWIGIISELQLRRPIYKQVAAFGHFGRSDLDLPWERTDRAADLAEAAGTEPLVSASLTAV
jgi:hypothetical protein